MFRFSRRTRGCPDRRPRGRATVAALAVVVVSGALTLLPAAIGESAVPVAAAAQPPLPVPGTVLSGIGEELANPGGSSPGSNDWSCRPTVAHPDPVILLHGTAGNRQTEWGTLSPLLVNAGYCVFALTYGNDPSLPWPLSGFGGLGPLEQSGVQLADFVHRVLAETGARKVDVVGHSLGTILPEYYAKFLGGTDTIGRYVSLAPFWNQGLPVGTPGLGTSSGGAVPAAPPPVPSLCASCDQTDPGAPFMTMMQSGGVYSPQIRYTNIMTRYDEVVVPYTDGYAPAPNATNIVVQDQCAQDFSEHLALVADPVALTDVLNALDPAHPRPVPCTFVPPFLG
ncbi:alpha/beta fold hydrolase [Rhodococcus sp. D2-41]|nr:alpha/beta fold hydrolase [Rhodococcus sp. D2-41]